MNKNYSVDPDRISHRENCYSEFWGRAADLVLHQTDDAIPHIDTYRFPEEKSAELGDVTIYLTGGMSDVVQPGTENYDETYQHVELSTYAPRILMNDSGNTDLIGWTLGWMGHYPFDQKTYFTQAQTFDWGKAHHS